MVQAQRTSTPTLAPARVEDPWPGRETVESREFRAAAGVTRQQLRHAMRTGVIEPAGLGRDGVFLFTKEDALLLLQAALFAAALGVALAAVLRGVESGAIQIPT